MHVSLGRAGDGSVRDYALQAVRRGYAALALEVRGFGERRDRRPAEAREERYEPDSIDPNVTCKHAAMVALLLGRTSLGEKILDLRRAIDALANSRRSIPGASTPSATPAAARSPGTRPASSRGCAA
jgi:hypothetical protein